MYLNVHMAHSQQKLLYVLDVPLYKRYRHSKTFTGVLKSPEAESKNKNGMLLIPLEYFKQ